MKSHFVEIAKTDNAEHERKEDGNSKYSINPDTVVTNDTVIDVFMKESLEICLRLKQRPVLLTHQQANSNMDTYSTHGGHHGISSISPYIKKIFKCFQKRWKICRQKYKKQGGPLTNNDKPCEYIFFENQSPLHGSYTITAHKLDINLTFLHFDLYGPYSGCNLQNVRVS